jgi:hypothetical protein
MRRLLILLLLEALIHSAKAQRRPPQNFTPTAVSGKQGRAWFFYAVNPDCTNRGEIESRILKNSSTV